MKKLKYSQKGITLIALIITIILMLILAGVVISLTLGENGLFSTAKYAGKQYGEEAVKERVVLMLGDYSTSRYTNGKELKDYLEEQKNAGNIEEIEKSEDNEEGTKTIIIDGYRVIINEETLEIIDMGKVGPRPVINEGSITILQEDGSSIPTDGVDVGIKLKIDFTASIEGGEIVSISPAVPYTTDGEEKEVVFTLTGNIQGETVTTKKTIRLEDKYKEPPVFSTEDIKNSPVEFLGSTVTGYKCEKQNACGWKILYVGENNIYLIADEYIHYNDAPLGKKGTSLTKNSNYCMSFNNVISDYNGTADITDERIRKLNNDYFSKGYTNQNINMKIVAYMLDIEAWSGYNGEKAEYAIGGPTVELVYKSYNQKYNTNLGYTVPNASGYSVNTNIRDYFILNANNAVAMWIASPYYGSTTNHLVTYNNKATFGDLYTRTTQGLRPVVCLKSDVKLEKKIDGTYEIK